LNNLQCLIAVADVLDASILQNCLNFPLDELQIRLRVANNPRHKTDKEYGRADRKYLRPAEVEAMIRAAKEGRRGVRDALMINLAYHHGLRVTELVELKWDAFDLKAGTIAIARLKGGVDGVQHLAPADARALRALRSNADGSSNVFASITRAWRVANDAGCLRKTDDCVLMGERVSVAGGYGSQRSAKHRDLCAGRCRVD
jgi:integrase